MNMDKTPFDDLEFTLTYNVIKDDHGGYTSVICRLIHKDLPLEFSLKFECTNKVKPEYIRDHVSKLINRLYKEVYNASLYSKATKPFIFDMDHKIYTGEWDNKLLKWFVYDSFENVCYSYNDMQDDINDELNTY